jgi:uncharacterized protein
MPPDWFALLLLGAFAGIFSGLFGIGGGVIIVPVLLILFPTFTTVEATATSLAALLLPVGILAVFAYHRAKLIDVKSAVLIAVGLLITTAVGAVIAVNLPDVILRQVYGFFLLFIGWRFIEPRVMIAQWRGLPPPRTAPEETTDPQDVPWFIVFTVGLVAGVLSGMFGIGGGAVIVPALVAILKYDQKLAVGTSLGALMLPVGLPGVIYYYSEGVLDLALAIPLAAGLVFGALLGARIALGLPSRTVKRMYGFFLWFVAIRFIFGL